MPVEGRKPKPDGQKRNHHRPAHDWIEVLDAPFKTAPKLPERQPGGAPWPPWTRQWWAAVSKMPHCVLWGPPDWRFAMDTAVVAARFHQGDMRAAAELRNREKLLGSTFDARRDLRIRYVSELPTAPAAGVTRIDDYRAALG